MLICSSSHGENDGNPVDPGGIDMLFYEIALLVAVLIFIFVMKIVLKEIRNRRTTMPATPVPEVIMERLNARRSGESSEDFTERMARTAGQNGSLHWPPVR